jgi:hypothetical protein
VAREVELRVDGVPAPLSLIERSFPNVDSMREGLGAIRIKLHTSHRGRQIRFENRHLPQVSVYLVNCLAAPSDGLVVSRQKRDEVQRSIEFEYAFDTPWPFLPAGFAMLLVARVAVLIYRSRRRLSPTPPRPRFPNPRRIAPSPEGSRAPAD